MTQFWAQLVAPLAGVAAAGVLTSLATVRLRRVLRTPKPGSVQATQGEIAPDRWSAWVTVIVGGVACVVGVTLMLNAGDALVSANGLAGVVIAVFGLAIAGFMAPSLTSLHMVSWSQEGIEGPSRLFGPTLGLARTRIPWPDIASTGTTATSYWYIQAQDGRRIYWSYLYRGNATLTQALKVRRPDLGLPEDMD